MHDDRTCVGIFDLCRGCLPAQGPPVNVPIRSMAHCIMSFLQMAQRETCSYQQIFLSASGDRTRDLKHKKQTGALTTWLPGFLESEWFTGDTSN